MNMLLFLPLAQAAAPGKGLNYFEVLIYPGGGYIGLFLWCVSVVMLGQVIRSFIMVRRVNILPPLVCNQVRSMLESKQYREAIDVTGAEPSFFSGLIHAAMLEAPRGYASMERAMEDAASDRTTQLLRSAEWLNLLGNVGPMIGLLGTVWGMIRAFFAIVAAGGIPSASMLAEALGVKLVCTLVGLIVAIPSLTVYGITRNRIDTLTSEAVVAAQELIASFRPGAKRLSTTAAAGEAQPQAQPQPPQA